MKKLLVMRHAKSDWSNDNLSDFDRPLNERGEKSAPYIGKELKKMGLTPELILSSPANRAKSTAILFAKNNGYEKEIKYIDDFYFGNLHDIFKHIKLIDDSIENLMIIGHNPTWENIVNNLNCKQEYFEMSTANLVILSADIKSWSELKDKCFNIQAILKPK